MSEYSAKEALPSCDVEKDLLADIEGYILRKASEISSNGGDIIRKRYYFSVEEERGTETLDSTSEYRLSHFPDDTKSIILDLDLLASKCHLSIRLSFNVERHFSYMKVRCDGDSAREIVLGLTAGLHNIIKPYVNRNAMFHLSPGIEGFIFGTMITISVVALVFLLKGSLEIGIVGLAITIMSSYFLYLKRLKPFSVFSTRRNANLHKWHIWLFWGAVGFVVFSVIGVYIRKRLLGF